MAEPKWLMPWWAKFTLVIIGVALAALALDRALSWYG